VTTINVQKRTLSPAAPMLDENEDQIEAAHKKARTNVQQPEASSILLQQDHEVWVDSAPQHHARGCEDLISTLRNDSSLPDSEIIGVSMNYHSDDADPSAEPLSSDYPLSAACCDQDPVRLLVPGETESRRDFTVPFGVA
jgi:hypothetical protein